MAESNKDTGYSDFDDAAKKGLRPLAVSLSVNKNTGLIDMQFSQSAKRLGLSEYDCIFLAGSLIQVSLDLRQHNKDKKKEKPDGPNIEPSRN